MASFVPEKRPSPEVTLNAGDSLEQQRDVDREEKFDDLLQEIRVLLSGSQVLTAFLVILPFNAGFTHLNTFERGVYAATFLTALLSLILFATPAAQHRLNWPLPDRPSFKRFSNRMVIAGLLPLSLSLILATHLVLTEVVKASWTNWMTGGVAVIIAALWWIVPLLQRRRKHTEKRGRQ